MESRTVMACGVAKQVQKLAHAHSIPCTATTHLHQPLLVCRRGLHSACVAPLNKLEGGTCARRQKIAYAETSTRGTKDDHADHSHNTHLQRFRQLCLGIEQLERGRDTGKVLKSAQIRRVWSAYFDAGRSTGALEPGRREHGRQEPPACNGVHKGCRQRVVDHARGCLGGGGVASEHGESCWQRVVTERLQNDGRRLVATTKGRTSDLNQITQLNGNTRTLGTSARGRTSGGSSGERRNEQ